METILSSSGLAVCYQGADYQTIDRALKRLDSRLLLDRERDTASGLDVWCVRVRTGDDPRGWPTPVWWVDPDGRPRELSMGIVDQVAAQEVRTRDDVVTGKRLAESALRVRQKLNDDARRDAEDVIREHEHRLKAGHGKPVTFPKTLRKDAA